MESACIRMCMMPLYVVKNFVDEDRLQLRCCPAVRKLPAKAVRSSEGFVKICSAQATRRRNTGVIQDALCTQASG